MARGEILCMGDKTTCGGVILEGNPHRQAYGRPVARMNDRVRCGKDGNIYKIIGGIDFIRDNGVPIAGTLDSFCGCSCQSRFIVTQHPAMHYESQNDAASGHGAAFSTADKSAATAAAAVAAVLPATVIAAKKTATRVFTKSRERGAGNTDAGTTAEPHNNFGHLAYGVPTPVENAPREIEQHAQAAQRKPVEKSDSDAPWYKRLLGAKAGKPAQSAMPLAIPVATGGGAELAAGGMQLLRGMALAGGQLFSAASVGAVGVLYSRPLNQDEGDLLVGSQLAALAGKSAPTRIRFQWVDAGNGRFKPVAYHTGPDCGQDQVRVRSMHVNNRTGHYEFWADGATGPTIIWTPDETQFNAPTNTGDRDEPYQLTTITVLPLPSEEELGSTSTSLPMPDALSFDDYILINLPHGMPPIYIYLSRPPVKFLDVELYSDFKGRSRDGKYEADHMPSAAAIKVYFRRIDPTLSEDEINAYAQDVASIIIPKEVHQLVSETFGGRNNAIQIERDSWDLRLALDRNFNAIKPVLKNYGATENELEAAREKMHRLNEDMGLYK